MITHIAAGVDGYPEGRDAVALGAGLARATGADLMLVATYLDPPLALPDATGWTGFRAATERLLREHRDALAPDARIVAEADFSPARGLLRVIHREHRDLLVVGSSRQATEGHTRLGSHPAPSSCCAPWSTIACRGCSERL